jgi:hypothetical protein
MKKSLVTVAMFCLAFPMCREHEHDLVRLCCLAGFGRDHWIPGDCGPERSMPEQDG